MNEERLPIESFSGKGASVSQGFMTIIVIAVFRKF